MTTGADIKVNGVAAKLHPLDELENLPMCVVMLMTDAERQRLAAYIADRQLLENAYKKECKDYGNNSR
jgi:hypothetical protein